MSKTVIEVHKAKEYTRDDRVNRALSQARVAKLRANLDLDAIGVFVVSRRANGDMIILDGGHRHTALMVEDMGDLDISAIVHEGLDEEGEAKLFLRYNDRLSVDSLERFRLEVTAGNPEANILDTEIRKAGFVPADRKENAFTCIVALRTIYRGGTSSGREAHKQTISDTLRIIKDAWGTEKSATKETVKGIGGILLNHGDEIDQEHLVEALRQTPTGAQAVKVKATYHMREGGQPSRLAAELAIAELYNRGLPPNKKIQMS